MIIGLHDSKAAENALILHLESLLAGETFLLYLGCSVTAFQLKTL